jgi:hypothetical protein
LDNFFVGDADPDFSQGSVKFPYAYEDASPPLVNSNIIDLSLVPTVNSGLPYNRNAPLPPSYQFQIKLQMILDHHRINLTVHNEIIDLVKRYSSTEDNSLPFSSELLLVQKHFMKKLEKSLEVSKVKHDDIEVKLSSVGVASVAVFDLEAMIMSLLMDERLMTEENFADGLNIFTDKPEGVINDYGEIHTDDAWEPACQ